MSKIATPTVSSQSDLMIFGFRNGIPSADSAGRLKFGLEALSGVRRFGFIGDRGIEVTVDAESVSVDCVWQVILSAGFSDEEVELQNGLPVVVPAEFDGRAPEPSVSVLGGESVAA